MSPKTTPSAERPSAERLAVFAARAMVSSATLAKGPTHGIVRRIRGDDQIPAARMPHHQRPVTDPRRHYGSTVQFDQVSEPTAGLNWRYPRRLEHRAGLLRFPEYRIRNWCPARNVAPTSGDAGEPSFDDCAVQHARADREASANGRRRRRSGQGIGRAARRGPRRLFLSR